MKAWYQRMTCSISFKSAAFNYRFTCPTVSAKALKPLDSAKIRRKNKGVKADTDTKKGTGFMRQSPSFLPLCIRIH